MFSRRPHPQPAQQKAHFPSRVHGVQLREQATLEFIEELILSDQLYSFMDNVDYIAEECARSRPCHHEDDQANTGTVHCVICRQNWSMEIGSEIWSWFKNEFRYLFEDSRGKKDAIRDLKAKVANLEQQLLEKSDQVVKLEYDLSVARGYADITEEEDRAREEATEKGRNATVWHKHRELTYNCDRMERSRDHWKKAAEAAGKKANDSFSQLKTMRDAFQATTGNQKPLFNVLTNLVMEVEMLSSTVGSLVLSDEVRRHSEDIVVTHSVGSQGTLDRYLLDPLQRENMTIVRTEKCGTGGGETHVVCRGVYGRNRAPWGDKPTKSKHMVASSQDMEEVQTKLNQLAHLVAQAPHGGATNSAPTSNWAKRPRLTGSNATPVTPRPSNSRPPTSRPSTSRASTSRASTSGATIRPQLLSPPPTPHYKRSLGPNIPKPPLPRCAPRPSTPMPPKPSPNPTSRSVASEETNNYRGTSSEIEDNSDGALE